MKKYFLVSVHDVAKPFLKEVFTILDNLDSLVGSELSLAVTPTWHGAKVMDALNIAQIVNRTDADLLVHGQNHFRSCGYGFISCLTQSSDEFKGLSFEIALQTATNAKKQIEDMFRVAVLGFVPPAWQYGCLTYEELLKAGFKFLISYSGVHFNGGTMPLANYSWDNGRLPFLGYIGHYLGLLMSYLPSRLPCMTFHPSDVGSGFDKLGYKAISRLLENGYVPIRPSRLVALYEDFN